MLVVASCVAAARGRSRGDGSKVFVESKCRSVQTKGVFELFLKTPKAESSSDTEHNGSLESPQKHTYSGYVPSPKSLLAPRQKEKRHSNSGALARQKFQKLTESPKRTQKDSNPPFKNKHHPGRSTYTDRFAGEWASASRDGPMVENNGRGSRTMPPDPETVMQLRRRDPGSNSDQASSPKGHPYCSSSVHNQHGALLCPDAELTRCFVVEGSLAGVGRVKHLVIDRQPPVVCCLQAVRL
ncbi:hypothetical protein LZ31DRAFT_97452 [Colletotrichum somersetense]|nr:hypothetical protein LZ31DRAFT_97452 [Colletotrichum somersetense]